MPVFIGILTVIYRRSAFAISILSNKQLKRVKVAHKKKLVKEKMSFPFGVNTSKYRRLVKENLLGRKNVNERQFFICFDVVDVAAPPI